MLMFGLTYVARSACESFTSPQHSCGPGSADGCLNPPPVDTDGSAAAALSSPPKRPADKLKNMYTSGSKTGGELSNACIKSSLHFCFGPDDGWQAPPPMQLRLCVLKCAPRAALQALAARGSHARSVIRPSTTQTSMMAGA